MMRNPFNSPDTNKPIAQFQNESKIWEWCHSNILKEAKKNGVYINHTLWSEGDLLLIIQQLRFGKRDGWLCYIEDNNEPKVTSEIRNGAKFLKLK